MTKSLTEQWHDGKLPDDCYYILTENGHIRKDRPCFYSHTDEQCFCFTPNKDIEEVLCPVPSYEEHLGLLSDQLAKNEAVEINAELEAENKRLKEQLAIAIKALEYIRCIYDKNHPQYAYIARLANRKAKTALKETEGVK